MEPVAPVSNGASFSESSCIDTTKKVIRYIPLPLLGLTALGGLGFGFPALFASGTSAAKASAVASAAFDFFVSGVSIVTCGCYYHHLPEWEFEQNVNREGEENRQLGSIEQDIDRTVDNLDSKNKELANALKESEEKAKALMQKLDSKDADLIKLNSDLKETVLQFNAIQKDFLKAKTSLAEAKQVVASFVNLSSQMRENLKTTKATAELLGHTNQDFKNALKDFDKENVGLEALLKTYGQMMVKEHEEFLLLSSAYGKLDQICLGLKNDLEQLSKNRKELAQDISEDKANIARLEKVADRLKNITDNID